MREGPAGRSAQAGLILGVALVAGACDEAKAPPPRPKVLACGVELGVEVLADRGTASVHARVTNHTQEVVTIQMPYRCPAGLLPLTGLPAGFDPDEQCSIELCPKLEDPTWTLRPGESELIYAWRFQPTKTACNPPLIGEFLVALDVSAVKVIGGDAKVCAAPAVELHLEAP